MTLTEQYNLASNSDFIKRVTMAMINAAIAISNEGAGAANHALRARHAARVLESLTALRLAQLAPSSGAGSSPPR